MTQDLMIRPGMLAEDPASMVKGPERVDERKILEEALSEERSGKEKGPGEAFPGAGVPGAGIGREKPVFDREGQKAAIEGTDFAQMFWDDGQPVFSQEELAFLATGKVKGKIGDQALVRKTLLNRSYRWHESELKRREKKHERELEAAIATARAEADLSIFVNLTGQELWELVNDVIEGGKSLGIVGVEELLLTDQELQMLANPTKEVLLKFPRVARFILLLNVPEVRLLRAMGKVYKPKLQAMALRRAQAAADRERERAAR